MARYTKPVAQSSKVPPRLTDAQKAELWLEYHREVGRLRDPFSLLMRGFTALVDAYYPDHEGASIVIRLPGDSPHVVIPLARDRVRASAPPTEENSR